jgi:hypothetical protein
MLPVLTPLLFGLSFLSRMLGLGVAFVAIPVLGLFEYDLKDVIQPWAQRQARGGARCPLILHFSPRFAST